MKKVLKFLLEHKRYLKPNQIQMVNKRLEKLDMDRNLSWYKIDEFCKMKVLVDFKLDPPLICEEIKSIINIFFIIANHGI